MTLQNPFPFSDFSDFPVFVHFLVSEMKNKLNFGFTSLIQIATLKLKRVIPVSEAKKRGNPDFGGVSKDNFHSEESFDFQMLENIWDISPE
jgi:hypothetical protein